MDNPVINPEFDCTYYIGTTQRRIHLVAAPKGEGYVFNYTSESPSEFEQGKDVFVKNEADYDKELARLGLRKLDETAQAGNFVLGIFDAVVKEFTGKGLEERRREHGGIHSDTLMRHDTPKRISDLFATK